MFDDGITYHHKYKESEYKSGVKDIYVPSHNFAIISHKLNEIKEYYQQTTQMRNIYI